MEQFAQKLDGNCIGFSFSFETLKNWKLKLLLQQSLLLFNGIVKGRSTQSKFENCETITKSQI